MKFYMYQVDVNKYNQALDASGPAIRSLDRFTGNPIGKSWKPLRLPLDDHGRIGDFCPILGTSGVPVFTEKAWTALQPLIGPRVEALLLLCNQRYVHLPGDKHKLEPAGPFGPFFAINVLDVLDCLDHKKSDVRYDSKGRLDEIRDHVFRASRQIKSHIFKLVEQPGASGEVFVSEEFKRLVEQHKLKGLEFYPVPVADKQKAKVPDGSLLGPRTGGRARTG
jgi:hypothetical protein